MTFMAHNFDQNRVICVQLLLTLLSRTVRHTVELSEFEVFLEVTDDNGKVDQWTHRSEDLDIDIVHERATDLMKSALKRRRRSDLNNATSYVVPEEKTSVNKTSIRKKRDAETLLDCRDKEGSSPTITGIVAEPGQIVKVPCHFCDDVKRKALNAKVWYRFSRDNVGGEAIFNAEQVKFDKHDDVRMNRVYIQPDHTLVIDNFQPSDTGAYFCESYNSETFDRTRPFSFRAPGVDESSAAAILLAWKVVSGTTSITFMTIIDIMSPIGSDLVSYTLPGYRKPVVPRKNTPSNWITYTEWGEWGECSKCGDDGEKRRRGRCMVRKIDPNTVTKPLYLEEVLKIYPRGAPCQSSLFTDQTTLENVRNEIEVGSCGLPCGTDVTEFLGKRIAKLVIRKVVGVAKAIFSPGQIPTVLPNTQQGIEKEEGTSLKLFCPSVYEDSSVVWKKNSVVLNPTEIALNTSGRIRVDQYFRLVFKTLEMDDSAQYSCHVDFSVTVDYFVAVSSSSVDYGSWWPGWLILAGWYLAAIAIFLSVTVIKHAQRFDSTRARAYRTKAAIARAKGYRAYKDIYGEHEQKRRNYSKNANTTSNANSANNWNHVSDDDDEDEVPDLHTVFKRPEINRYVNNSNNDKSTTEESILTASTSSPERASFTTTATSASTTGEEQSVVETDLESMDLSSSEYGTLDSSSDWEFSSHYSDTGEESEIPDEPYWMIF